jgi:heme exporter protein D
MDIEILILDGYGKFVWTAFIFTFAICFFLYLKTFKEFKKQEKIFLNEFKELKSIKIQSLRRKKVLKETLSTV